MVTVGLLPESGFSGFARSGLYVLWRKNDKSNERIKKALTPGAHSDKLRPRSMEQQKTAASKEKLKK
jgi:hypothetical protein